MSPYDEDAQPGKTPFRVAAIVRRSLAIAVPLAPRSYIDDSRRDLEELCRTDWDFVTQTIGRSLHSLVHSLPAEDAMRTLRPGEDLSPSLGYDLVIPTSDDLELDVDYLPASRPAEPGAAQLLRLSAGSVGADDVVAALAARTPDGGAAAPTTDEETARQSAYLAAEDAYRWLLWRRTAYLLGEDPEGVRVVSTWAHILDRTVAGEEIDTAIIERLHEDLAIGPQL